MLAIALTTTVLLKSAFDELPIGEMGFNSSECLTEGDVMSVLMCMTSVLCIMISELMLNDLVKASGHT